MKQCEIAVKSLGLTAFLLAGLAGGALPAAAKNWYYVGGPNAWLDPASYSETTSPSGNTEMPGSDDQINIRKGQKLTVDDSTVSFFSTVKAIYPNCEDTEIVFDLKNDATVTAAIGDIGGHAYTNNWLRKLGAGKLTLGCNGNDTGCGVFGATSYAYKLNIDVQGGSLQLQGKIPGNATTYYPMGYLNVASGATAYLHGGVSRIESITGGGVVANGPETTDLQLLTAGGPDEFAGQLKLENGVDCNMPRSIFLAGDNNIFSLRCLLYGYDDASWLAGNGSGRGVVGFKTLGGTRNGKSSLGGCHLNEIYGAVRYVYLGTTEETIYRDMNFAYNENNPNGDPGVFDAGAYGGITLCDQCAIGTYVGANNGQHRLVLDGSNVIKSVFGALVQRATSPAGKTASFFITKRGTGTWKFDQRNYCNFTGVLAVENGKVEFDTIAESNKWCSLGWSSDLYEDKADFPENLTPVDYAYLMGGNGGKGFLDYTGSKAIKCETRRLGLRGKGGLSASAGLVKWADAFAVGLGEKALVLSGELKAENTFSGIDEKDGKVSVIKEGSGDWTLTGGLNFSGDVKVAGGSLTIRNSSYAPYRWFRLVLKENVNASAAYPDTKPAPGAETTWPNEFFWLNSFALYDAEGHNRAVFRREDKDPEAIAVQPSHCSDDGKIAYDAAYMDTARLFMDDATPTIDGAISRRAGFRNTDYRVAKLTDPTTWMTIDLRLADDVPEIKGYDLCASYVRSDGYFGTAPAAYEVFGSADGIRFEHIGGTDAADWHDWSGQNLWLSDGSAFVKGAVRQGIPLDRTVSRHVFGGLKTVRSIEIASGATLNVVGEKVTANGLTVGAEGMGTVSGVKIGTDGAATLDVVCDLSAKPERVFIPADFTQFDDWENIRNWTVTVNGMSQNKYIVSVAPNGVTLMRKGFAIIFR